jgi:ATP-dependent DNA helicase RecG
MQASPSDVRLIDLVNDLRRLPAETNWVEFKINNAAPQVMGQRISALANGARLADQPFAYFIWGIENETHKIAGTRFDPSRARTGGEPLEFWLSKMLFPCPSLRFHVVQHPEGRVVLLEIPAASHSPVKFQGHARIRIGSATPPLSDYPEHERTLWAKLQSTMWETAITSQYVPGRDVLQSLDFTAYFDLTQQQRPAGNPGILRRMSEDRLLSADVGGRWNILNLGAILLAKRLEDFDRLSRKRVRIIQYGGTDKTVTKRRHEQPRGYASGFEAVIQFIDGLLPGSEEIGPALRTEQRLYPLIAIRELVANALIHQDMTATGAGPMIEIFDDRIEVTNPGPPVTDMTNKLFGAPPRSRNEALATLMRRMRICEEQGSGLVKIITAAEAARLPAPEFRRTETSTQAILFGPRPFSSNCSPPSRAERDNVCHAN